MTRTLTEALVLVLAVGVSLIIGIHNTRADYTGPAADDAVRIRLIVVSILVFLNLGALLILLRSNFAGGAPIECVDSRGLFLPPPGSRLHSLGCGVSNTSRALDSGNIASSVSIAFDTTAQ
jgi:hypothetical protein